MPSRGGCSSARGPRAAGGPWGLLQTQPRPLLHEFPWSVVQQPGPGSGFPLDTDKREQLSF